MEETDKTCPGCGKLNEDSSNKGAMVVKKRMYSPSMFGLVILCFFLPFATISCAGQNVDLKAFDFVFGRSFSGQKIDPYPIAIILLLITIIGAGLYLWVNVNNAMVSLVLGALGIVFVIILRSNITSDVNSSDMGTVTVQYDIGFYLMILLYISIIIYNGYLIQTKNKNILNHLSDTQQGG